MTIFRPSAICSCRECVHNSGAGSGCTVRPTIATGSSGLAECSTLEKKEQLGWFEAELINTAHDIVGAVGQMTVGPLSVTDEPYVTVMMKGPTWNLFVNWWRDWLKAYKGFARFTKSDGQCPNQNGKLAIYWRVQPEITDSGVPGEDRYTLYARLLISPHTPSEGVETITPAV